MPEVVYLNQADFRKSMIRLRRMGGASQRAYDETCKLIHSLEYGVDVSNKLTNNGESRITHCVKYNVSNDAHRLVTVHSNHYIYLLFVGTHDDAEWWLNKNRGLTISCNPNTRKITVTHVTKDERRETPPVDLENLTEANKPYFERIDIDPSEYVKPRYLASGLSKVNDDTSDEELNELLEDLADLNKEIANLLLDIIFEIREGNIEAANARLEHHHSTALPVQEQEELERQAIEDVTNSEDLINLTGLTEEQLKDLFAPDKFQEWMLFLHPEQRKIAEADYDQSTVLTGVSGSGKTCVLVHRAKLLAKKYPGERIGIITLNRSLSRLINNLVTQLCTPEERANIHVMAFYDHFAELVKHFGPDKELQQLRKLAEEHYEKSHIQQVIDQVDPKRFAREWDPQSGENLEDTWDIFRDQEYVNTLMTYVRTHLFKLDDWVDSQKYLRDEFSLIRSAIPTSIRVDGYLELERKGRGIPIPAKIRKHILDLLLLYEETMLHGGILDELGLTLALMPHRTELKDLPPEKRFRCLLIDEFQDLSTRDLSLLRLIPTEQTNGLFLTGDTVQRVMVKDLRMDAVGLDKISVNWAKITKNYRNSRQILEAASCLANNYGETAKELGMELEILEPELAVRETSYPVAEECHPDKELSNAWQYALSCLQANAATPWSICIVTAAKNSISPDDIIAARPAECPVKAGRVTGDYTEEQDTISVGTMADVKGFEFSLVIIVGCGKDHLPGSGGGQNEIWRDALRLYVAMTRARDEVRLFYSGNPSPFLEDMNEGIYWKELATTTP